MVTTIHYILMKTMIENVERLPLAEWGDRDFEEDIRYDNEEILPLVCCAVPSSLQAQTRQQLHI